MDWIHEKPRHARGGAGKIALALAATALSAVGIAAYAQSNKATGKAQVIERRGPQISLAANGGGQVVVLFPQAVGGGQQADVEVILVESQQPAAAEGQPAAAATPTGREVLFSTRDANDGLVRYALEAGGTARQMMVLARVGGKYVEAREAGGGGGVMVYTVQQPTAEANATAGAEAGAAPAADAAQSSGGGAPAAPAGEGAGGSAQQPQGPPPQVAIIMVYTAGAQ